MQAEACRLYNLNDIFLWSEFESDIRVVLIAGLSGAAHPICTATRHNNSISRSVPRRITFKASPARWRVRYEPFTAYEALTRCYHLSTRRNFAAINCNDIGNVCHFQLLPDMFTRINSHRYPPCSRLAYPK